MSLLPHREKNGFTAIRLIGAFLVLLSHSSALLKGRQDFLGRHHFPQIGELAVDAFFVISGYLITGSLLKSPGLFNYLRNRSLRLFPGLIVAVFVTVFIIGPLFCDAAHYWSLSPSPLYYLKRVFIFPSSPITIPQVFANNPVQVINGSLWTLSLEILFYMGLLLLSVTRTLRWPVLGFLLLATLTIQQLGLLSHSEFFIFQLDRLSVFFIGGALLASIKNKLSYPRPLLIFLSAVVFFAFVGHRWPNWHQPLLFMILWPYLVVGLAQQLHRLSWLDQYDFSYGIYIYSFVVQQCLIAATGGVPYLTTVTLTVAAMIITIPIALASWFWVERPFIRLKRSAFLKKPSAAAALAMP